MKGITTSVHNIHDYKNMAHKTLHLKLREHLVETELFDISFPCLNSNGAMQP